MPKQQQQRMQKTTNVTGLALVVFCIRCCYLGCLLFSGAGLFAIRDVPTAAFEVNGRRAHLALHFVAFTGCASGGSRGRKRNDFLKLITTLLAYEFIQWHRDQSPYLQ